MANIILHQFQGVSVGLQEKNCYINATAMATAYKHKTGQRRDVSDWTRGKRTQEMIEHLGSVTGIPVTGLVIVVQGGTPSEQGTWIHPRLAVRFAIWLSDDFGLAVEDWITQWSTYQSQRKNSEWIEARKTGKIARKNETDGIKLFIGYAKTQGSQNAEKYYMNLTKMENKALFLVEQKYPNLREILGITELGLVSVADTIILRSLTEGMEKAMYYKDIYKLAKERVEKLAELHGKILIPSQQLLPSY